MSSFSCTFVRRYFSKTLRMLTIYFSCCVATDAVLCLLSLESLLPFYIGALVPHLLHAHCNRVRLLEVFSRLTGNLAALLPPPDLPTLRYLLIALVSGTSTPTAAQPLLTSKFITTPVTMGAWAGLHHRHRIDP